MSVAALPPPSLQPRMAMPTQSKRPVMMPRPSASTSSSSTSSTPALAARPPPGLKAKPTTTAPPPVVRRPSSTASSSTPRSTPAALPQPIAGSSKDTSSSSGKVFAKPSKEWVLPERAKPGRKVSVEEPDNKRQSQNRLSQRAHRARRTDYIQTLEERLRQYEADEIHSNVRLQEVARALKADNERLKKEVVTLRMDLNELTSQREGWESERSSYEDLVARLSAELHSLRGSDAASPHFIRHQHSTRSSPLAMPTLVPNTDRRPTMDCPICPDPDPDCPCQQRDSAATTAPPQHTASAPLAALHLAVKAMAEQDPSPTPGGNACGVCTSDDECLCRAIDDMEEDVKPVIFPTPSPESDLLGGVDFGGPVGDGCGLCTSASFCACRANASSNGSSQSPVMGLSTMVATATTTVYPTPPYSTAAVPLKLRRAQNKPKSIWALEPVAPSPPKRNDDAMCSGDPSNCEACRDDSFGKEFCSNLFEKTEAEPAFKPCNDCPGNCMSIQSLLGPSVSPQAGTSALAQHDPTHDHDHNHGHARADDSAEPPRAYTVHAHGDSHEHEHDPTHASHETMTCDQAWKTLKAHPNSRFASLSLLADVVAGRTVCTGPKADDAVSSLPGSPVPPSLAQEIGVGAPKVRNKPTSTATSAATAPSSSPAPTAMLAPTARKRNMAVETSAVRDALRLLDKTPGPSPGLRPSSVPLIRVEGEEEPEGREGKRRKVEV